MLANYTQRKVWLALEANSEVVQFCERPAFVQGERGQMFDFWVKFTSGVEEFWLIQSEGEDIKTSERQPQLYGRALRYVDDAALQTWDMALANWDRIISQLTAWRRYRDPLLSKRILLMLGVPLALGDVIARLSHHDPEQVEAELFALLAGGQVQSPQLSQMLLDDQTMFERAR
ncbi:MAG: hypothetical protein KGI52_03045 [Burkholderiales bacterium]|nr:hypothetical protein [Burkholderiales bacterium]